MKPGGVGRGLQVEQAYVTHDNGSLLLAGRINITGLYGWTCEHNTLITLNKPPDYAGLIPFVPAQV